MHGNIAGLLPLFPTILAAPISNIGMGGRQWHRPSGFQYGCGCSLYHYCSLTSPLPAFHYKWGRMLGLNISFTNLGEKCFVFRGLFEEKKTEAGKSRSYVCLRKGPDSMKEELAF